MSDTSSQGHIESLAMVSEPLAEAEIKRAPEDFIVTERLGFEPTGSGEHYFLDVRTTAQNTQYVARHLARVAGLSPAQVNYSGLKDRHAVTRQWFSLHMPGKQILEPEVFDADGIEVISAVRHNRKLRLGTHRANHFSLNIKWVGPEWEPADLAERVKARLEQGAPNYFGPQRFGRGESNLLAAFEAVARGGRLKRSLKERVYSTLRSFLFNQYLSYRICHGDARQYLQGDLFMLSGSHSFFVPEQIDAEIERRLQERDITIGGILPGCGELPLTGESLKLYAAATEPYQSQCDYLSAHQVKWLPRSLWVYPGRVSVTEHPFEERCLKVEFELPPGSFATAMLRESFSLIDRSLG